MNPNKVGLNHRNYMSALHLFIATSILFFSNILVAANEVSVDQYTFQYNAFPSDTLPVSMTQKYNFIRSKNKALVNITVIDNTSAINYKGIKANLSGVMQNLLGQQLELNFQEIYEDNAYYYIAQTDIEHNDVVQVKIKAQPLSISKDKSVDKIYNFKFTKQFATR